MRKKRILFIVITAVIVIFGILGLNYVRNMQLAQFTEDGQLLYSWSPIQVYLKDGNYVIAVIENQKTVKGVEFSPDRQVLQTIGIDPVEVTDISRFLNKTLDEIEAELGPYHIDIGSGHFMPSYFTADGYFVCFTFIHSKETSRHVSKMDLFTNDSVEWYFADSLSDT